MAAEIQHLEARAFCATVEVIRKAQGKVNPDHLPSGSMGRMLAKVDLINDTLRFLGIVIPELEKKKHDEIA